LSTTLDRLGWAGVAAVLALWLHGDNLHQLGGGASAALIAGGRATGLIAAQLLLMQVLLMARLPWLERGLGQDVLARKHRVVGFWSVNLLVVHVVLTTLGYAAADRAAPLREAWTVVRTYPGMLLATAATVALLAVAVTSVRLARARLRYESWHLLHLYAYVGVALSIPHEIWAGGDFTSSRPATVYWVGLWAAAAGAVVVFRIGVPVGRTLRHRVRVTEVIRESPDVVTVRMTGRALDRLPVHAGQYFVWRFLDGPGWTRGNPYSLSAPPGRHELQITARTRGDGSARLARLRPGTRVMIEGPFGRLTADRVRTGRVAMFACGIGITPLHAVLRDLRLPPGAATLIYRARTADDVVFGPSWADLMANQGLDVRCLLGPRLPAPGSWLPAGAAGHDPVAALRTLVPDLTARDVFVCGPHDWMDALVTDLRSAGLPDAQLHLERFAW